MPPIFGGIMPHAGDLNAGPGAVKQNRTDSKDQISNISKFQASLARSLLEVFCILICKIKYRPKSKQSTWYYIITNDTDT